ncbi:putative Transmembrane protein [Quillaja saponaria]|uniref:Transmembrane protein n=1 Tax=Quillaja saponaria TaxID=32244 RepID=A0AAD7P544_QUISA|nr:putative Transmembrane protein [Quillaja saponaria]
MSDSLVRVSRRAEWGARRPTPGARRCRSTPRGARCQPRSRRRHILGRNSRPGLGRRRNPRRSAPRVDRRTGVKPFHIRPGRIAGPHPLPSRQFQALFDSLFKVLFIFPSRYLFAIGLSPVFSLGQNLLPDWGCIPKQPDSPTAPRGATGSGHDGALTLSGAPFQGTWARSVAEDASPDYNSDAEGARFSWWALPGSLAVTRGILRCAQRDRVVAVPGRQQALSTGLERYSTTACRGACHRGLLFGPAASRGSREASVRPWTPSTTPQLGGGERRGSGQRCVTPRQTCPRPDGLGRNLRSKTRWFTGFCNSHQVSHFATFFIDARAEISVAESRFRYRFVHCIPRGTVSGTAGACVSIGFPWRALRRGSLCCREAPPPRRKGRPPEQREGRGDGFAGRSVCQDSTMILPQHSSATSGAARPPARRGARGGDAGSSVIDQNGTRATTGCGSTLRRYNRVLRPRAKRAGAGRTARSVLRADRNARTALRSADCPGRASAGEGTIEGLEFRRTGSQHRNRQLASEAVTALGAAMRSRTSVQFGARARSLRARTTETPLTRHHVHKEQPRQPDHDSPTSAGRAMEATGGAVPAPLGMTGKPGNAGVRHRPRVHRRLRPRGARRASPRKARHVSRGRVDPFETST